MPIYLIAYYSDILPIVFFLVFLNKIRHERILWVIFIYAIISFINVTLLLYVFRDNDLKGYFAMSIFTAIEFVCFVLVFIYLLKSEVLLSIVKVISLAFLFFCIFSIVGSNHQTQFDSIQSSIASLLIIMFSIFYFYEKINEPQLKFIYSDYHFWIILAFLIYLSATLFLYVYVTSLPRAEADEWWILNSIGNIAKNILFSIAIIKFVNNPSNLNTPKTPKAPKEPTTPNIQNQIPLSDF
jgi:hypothetical protein